MPFPLFKQLLCSSYVLGTVAGLEITALSLRCLSDVQVEGGAIGDTELEVKNKKEVGSYLHMDGSES